MPIRWIQGLGVLPNLWVRSGLAGLASEPCERGPRPAGLRRLGLPSRRLGRGVVPLALASPSDPVPRPTCPVVARPSWQLPNFCAAPSYGGQDQGHGRLSLGICERQPTMAEAACPGTPYTGRIALILCALALSCLTPAQRSLEDSFSWGRVRFCAMG